MLRKNARACDVTKIITIGRIKYESLENGTEKFSQVNICVLSLVLIKHVNLNQGWRHLIFLLKNHWKYLLLSPTLCHQNLILQRKDDVDI